MEHNFGLIKQVGTNFANLDRNFLDIPYTEILFLSRFLTSDFLFGEFEGCNSISWI